MFHPDKPWKMPFGQIVAVHAMTMKAPDIFGGIPALMFGDLNVASSEPLAGSRQLASDQRSGDAAAFLFRNPSMIL